MNVPAQPLAVNHRPTRSNSTSSSISTLKYNRSRSGQRLSRATTRPTSSDSINYHFSVLDAAEQSTTGTAHDRTRPAKSPIRNINRWSHSTTSSMGAVEKDGLRQIPPNSIAARAARFEQPSRPAVALRSQYSLRQPSQLSLPGPSYSGSSSDRSRSPQKRLPDRYRGVDRSPTIGSFSDRDLSISRPSPTEYYGTTILDHSRGANKFGQPVEGIALQVTSVQPMQKRADQSKVGSGLYDASNSSHISTQKKHRRREQSENGGHDGAPGGSVSSLRSEHSKKISHRSPLQKNMLSQALNKANQAVLLDNAQDIQGAIEAYVEACDILEQVMLRSSDNEDRKKLSAIRNTYSSRIADLYDIDKTFDHLSEEKELPEAPITTHYVEEQDRVSFEDPEDVHPQILIDGDGEPPRSVHIPLRQESLLPQIFGGDRYLQQQLPASRQRAPPTIGLNVPMDSEFMPPPLSPRRPPSPAQDQEVSDPVGTIHPHQEQHHGQEQRLSSGSRSWLDTIEDNMSSLPSSRLSSVDYGNQDGMLVSAIEAELSAAVDDAYEEKNLDATPRPSEVRAHEAHDSITEDVENQHYLMTQPSQDSMVSDLEYNHIDEDYYEEDEEEAAEVAEVTEEDEEELLDMMMAEGYTLDNQKQHIGAMSSLPRQSDSSGLSVRSSGRTWESSLTTATNGTALSTLAESPEVPQHETAGDLKETEEATLPAHESDMKMRLQAPSLVREPSIERLGLRDRRMSGNDAKQLKIETYIRRPSISQQGQPTQTPLLEIPSAQSEQPELVRSGSATNLSLSTLPTTPLASIHSTESTESPGTPALNQTLSQPAPGEEPRNETRMSQMHKTTSTSDPRARNLSVTTSDLNDMPLTPGSGVFNFHSRQATSAVTPAFPSASPNVLSSTAVGGMYIFDHITDPVSPGARSPESTDPLPLEPCPEAFLLRPFWLMRCLYQTMAHPKGGYISTKLFIPRDIWRVKGIKIKGIEDKISQCDILTNALLKLAKVDTLDAAACCEELQSFETILDQVRVQLQKKLGGDVGITGSMAAMKASPAEDAEVSSTKTSSSMKSFTNSLRKLRSKSSNTVMSPPLSLGIRKETSNDISMPSLPMTSSSAIRTSRSYRNQRYPPPTPTGMPFVPALHATYMCSLSRLFDAVQVLDSIARQVEDPGLKATSLSHVGLELSIRGAAEFFSFYILRFVLADIGMMVDKYLKRNSEWIMT